MTADGNFQPKTVDINVPFILPENDQLLVETARNVILAFSTT